MITIQDYEKMNPDEQVIMETVMTITAIHYGIDVTVNEIRLAKSIISHPEITQIFNFNCEKIFFTDIPL